jgi:hypothetical protein
LKDSQDDFMSSPFRYFRKHTKAFMAVAAVLAIFIFVVGGAISSSTQSGGGGQHAGATVATWNGGSLTEGQLQSLIAQRLIVNDFLQRLFAQGGGRSGYDFPPNVPVLLLRGQSQDYLESEVIDTEVISTLATQAGITVSDAMINHSLEEWGLKKVSKDEIVGILKGLGQGNARANEAIVFSMLRKLLLADFYRRMFSDASMVVLPEQRWNDWLKVNERVSIQAAEIPVDKFLDQVPQPTEPQLQALYQQYQDADPNRHFTAGGRDLPSPDPGFAVPRRVRLAYLRSSVAQRAEKLAPEVTAEEIKAYYDANKMQFIKLGLPGDEPATPADQPATETTPDAAGAATDAAPASEGAAASPDDNAAEAPATQPESPAEAPAGDTAPEAEAPAAETAEPAAESAPAETPAAPQPADAVDATPASEESQPAPADQPSSSVDRPSPFRLVAYQAESSESSSEAPATGEPAATDAAPEPEKEPEAPAAAETPAESADAASAADAPVAAAPADAAADAAKANATAADPANSDADKPEPDAAPAAQKADETEYEPLEKVQDDIRRTVANQKAEAELERIMGEAAAQLQSEYNRYGSQVVEAKELKKKAPEPPAKLTDLAWLAEKYGLIYESTEPLTARELSETAVGKAADAASERVSVTQAAFTTLQLYEPFLAREVQMFGSEALRGDWYLALKTEDTPRRIPEFSAVRDQVAAAWKQQEAAKLAEKKAKELAAEAEKSSETFEQFFKEKGYTVIPQTEYFSWWSYPLGRAGAGNPPGLGDIPELKNIGPDFLEAAVNLNGKETKGLLNFDHSTAYVIRLNRRQLTEQELKKQFLDEEGAWPGQVGIDMLSAHASTIGDAVRKEIQERADFAFDEGWLARRREKQQENQ